MIFDYSLERIIAAAFVFVKKGNIVALGVKKDTFIPF